MLSPFGRSEVALASGSELGLDAVGVLTWSRGKRGGYVTCLPPSRGVIWMVGWAVEASNLMGLP